MKVHFYGAAQTVTGSMHLCETGNARILLDCGLYQGRREESRLRNQTLGFDPKTIDVCVLSHAHIDHSGSLPTLVKRGFKGNIYCTPATRDLAVALLADAAMIQVSDARYLNKRIERGEIEGELVEPLYDEEDVVETIRRMVTLPYHHPISIADGVTLTFYDAGHVLGSASVALDHEGHRFLFSGDLGRIGRPILRDPEIPPGVDTLMMESTYGDRLHKTYGDVEDALAEVVNRTIARGGKLIIPSFALERAQEVILALKHLRTENKIPRIPVYLDSPLAVKVTEVFRLHPDCYDAETRELLRHGSPFDFDGLKYISEVEDSKAISTSEDPCIVIAASGMCESGRVLHHLKNSVEDPRDTIMIVGFQAPHTLGRRLVEGRDRVRIFGVEYDRKAEVVVQNGFSAHGDQNDLLKFAEGCRAQGKASKVILVHGEPRGQQVLAEELRKRDFLDVSIPAPRDSIDVG